MALIDPKPLAGWRNNYGVWCDEFEALGFEDCYRASWPRAQVIFGDAETPEENDRQTGKIFRPSVRASGQSETEIETDSQSD